MADGWDQSAAAWIADMADEGDFGRRFVLDAPMLARVSAGGFQRALDVGCGEGRFCRKLRSLDIAAIGIDPTQALIERAQHLDPGGDYRMGRAEALAFPDCSFDLVVSYLTLIDIPDVAAAIAEMTRVLRPGGALLIANLNSFMTASQPDGWTRDADGKLQLRIDNYMTERADWVSWRGIRIRNWHRPLSTYMSVLLENGLQLVHFSEPLPHGGDPDTVSRYRRAPWFLIMEWRKPLG
ncbi:class I SAM-dependent methyltransferase [Rhodopseudomonas telluris]|uniref:Class I SAM-dependent methyltransferase n=1 Tax=Rhodopseudomonas telluris TaxID=644215 RepID=A0ABV6EZF2_9BRAD